MQQGSFRSDQNLDILKALDESLTKMYDDIWLDYGLEEEEIFNEFYDHKCPFNPRYLESRENSWRRLADKITTK